MRELYRSSNGDRWLLACDPSTKHGYVLHEPNAASGGLAARIEIGRFLEPEGGGPEHQALLRLIGTLAETSPEQSGAESAAQLPSSRLGRRSGR